MGRIHGLAPFDGAASRKGKLPRWLRADDVYSWHRLDWRRASDRRAYAHYLEERAKAAWESPRSSRGARQEMKMLQELRRGWVLGSEAVRDQMSDLASDIVRGRKRESYSGEEVRRYDETAARELLTRGLEVLGMEPQRDCCATAILASRLWRG